MSPDEQEHARLAEALADPLVLALMVRFSPDLRMAEITWLERARR